MNAGLIMMAASALLAQDAGSSQLVRQGDYWKRTDSGPLGPVNTRVLRISTRGHVIVHGTADDQLTYRLVQTTKARTRDEAHALFGSTTINLSTRKDVTIISLLPLTRGNVNSQLEINMPRRAGLILDTQAGDVEVYDLDSGLHVETTAGLIHCDRIRGNLESMTGGGEIRIGKVSGSVRCVSAAGSIFVDNAGADATCHTAGGEIQIREATGPLTLSTEGGNIQVDKAAASVEAHTVAGVIDISQAGGTVFADTRGGSIQIGSARGVQCQSEAGTIRVKTVAGPLRVQTAMGSILAEVVNGSRLEDSSLMARSGDITVLIPSNLALSVLARNDTGANPRIVSDFSELRAKSLGFNRPPLVYEGSINGGGPLLTLSTAGGIIYVKKLK